MFKGYVSCKRRVTFQVLRLQCIFRENDSQLGLEWNKAQLAFACDHSSIWCQELGAWPIKRVTGKAKNKQQVGFLPFEVNGSVNSSLSFYSHDPQPFI